MNEEFRILCGSIKILLDCKMNTPSPVASFCSMVRNRTCENRVAMSSIQCHYRALSPSFSILRQELDSMVRVIYLLQKNAEEQSRLIKETLNGEKWQIPTAKGKMRNVTDKEMVEVAQDLKGWTRSVYRFGCAFIHLSDHHNHYSLNPFDRLSENERQHILEHMRQYHHGPHSNNPTMEELAEYIPKVHDKVASNLECYLKDLEELHEATPKGAQPDAFGDGYH